MCEVQRCEQCGRKLNYDKITSLELDNTTGLYHSLEEGIPAGHTSQGCFMFGSDCAKKILKNGGQLDVEQARKAQDKYGF
jgi:hypothetical protein